MRPKLLLSKTTNKQKINVNGRAHVKYVKIRASRALRALTSYEPYSHVLSIRLRHLICAH